MPHFVEKAKSQVCETRPWCFLMFIMIITLYCAVMQVIKRGLCCRPKWLPKTNYYWSDKSHCTIPSCYSSLTWLDDDTLVSFIEPPLLLLLKSNNNKRVQITDIVSKLRKNTHAHLIHKTPMMASKHPHPTVTPRITYRTTLLPPVCRQILFS